MTLKLNYRHFVLLFNSIHTYTTHYCALSILFIFCSFSFYQFILRVKQLCIIDIFTFFLVSFRVDLSTVCVYASFAFFFSFSFWILFYCLVLICFVPLSIILIDKFNYFGWRMRLRLNEYPHIFCIQTIRTKRRCI